MLVVVLVAQESQEYQSHQLYLTAPLRMTASQRSKGDNGLATVYDSMRASSLHNAPTLGEFLLTELHVGNLHNPHSFKISANDHMDVTTKHIP